MEEEAKEKAVKTEVGIEEEERWEMVTGDLVKAKVVEEVNTLPVVLVEGVEVEGVVEVVVMVEL
jgi:hypothetical protein